MSGSIARGVRRLTVAALVAAMLGVAAAPPAYATPTVDSAGWLRTGVADLHALGITGVQALARDGVRENYARAGTADLATGAPVPRDGYFRMGSNTKTFAAVVVLQLVGEGRLRLDDTVERWLPGLVTGNGNDGRRITVRQLLQHTSGLYNYTWDLPGLSSAEGYARHRFDHYDPEELVALALAHPPNFAPGTSWDYSNTNYILAGMLIERVTGRTWAVELRNRVLRPLGLTETSSPGDRAHLPEPHAKGYQQWEPGGPLDDTTRFNTTMAYAAGDLVSTPSDLVRFWQALHQGRLLAPAQLAEMRRTVLAETFQEYQPGARYGLGIMWAPNACGGYWSHGGDVPGTSTVNGVTDDGRRAVVLSLTTQLAEEEAALAVLRRSDEVVEDALCGSGG
ncbi:serine hydrolase domain-containing protein [Plantactinospora endophytica]|uniref:Serine hydrolase n=1 Tax=Plantactinospora endophytica TaxID=673535 RepID=A0ABQ4E1L7_9ACTN|nr:serine hydrolase domain-containing protein [Plantactinospora endophytica]GIG88615.1 serine hydrolase [Plantactinospora endophytica]